MALIKCKECGTDVSTDAKNCPKCGAPLKKRRGCLPILGLGFLGLVALSAIGRLIGGPSTPSTPAQNTQADEDYATKALGEQAIRSMLKDPDSGVFTESDGHTRDGMHVACGYVNAKNSFGAMAGASAWLVIVETKVALIQTPENSAKFVSLWNKYCASQPAEPQHSAPTGFRDIKWFSPLPSIQMLQKTVLKGCPKVIDEKIVEQGERPPCGHEHSITDDDDADYFFQRQNVPPIFGVPVSEQMLHWSYRKFFGGVVWIYNYKESDLKKLRAALINQYGQPTFENQEAHITNWKWADKKLEIMLTSDPVPKPSLGSSQPPKTSIQLSFTRTDDVK